jgi:hypothetical protein
VALAGGDWLSVWTGGCTGLAVRAYMMGEREVGLLRCVDGGRCTRNMVGRLHMVTSS